MSEWKLKRTNQCAKCPWKKSVNPHDIPNGYSLEKHQALEDTIAVEGDLSFLSSNEVKNMACHETHDSHCVGWLNNQLGAGNNIALRLSVINCTNIGELKTYGEQHDCFQDTVNAALEMQ